MMMPPFLRLFWCLEAWMCGEFSGIPVRILISVGNLLGRFRVIGDISILVIDVDGLLFGGDE